jgi:hypothetical protein
MLGLGVTRTFSSRASCWWAIPDQLWATPQRDAVEQKDFDDQLGDPTLGCEYHDQKRMVRNGW